MALGPSLLQGLELQGDDSVLRRVPPLGLEAEVVFTHDACKFATSYTLLAPGKGGHPVGITRKP